MIKIDHIHTLFECLEENKPIPEYIRYDLKRIEEYILYDLNRIKEYILNYDPDKDMVDRIKKLENKLDEAMYERIRAMYENERLRNEICDLEDEISELKKHEYNPKG